MNNPALICQAYAFATVVLWSTAYVYTKVALAFFTPGPLGLVRCAVASLSFLVILPVMGKGRGGFLLPAVRHLLAVESRAYELVMLWLDSIGLGLFTVVGVQCAFQQAENYNLFLLVFVGVITGVGGGVLRDVLSNQKPYIFVKHFYACPTLIGALLCALCWQHLGDIPSMLLGAAVILVLRLCAAHFRWGLPHAADLPE